MAFKKTERRVEIENIVFIKGGAYNDIKKALRQWVDLYTSDLPDGLIFELYKNGRGNHIIKADDRLDNESFFYLVNYLNYPEGIEYKIDIEGFTTGKDEYLLKNKVLLVYIPLNDKEHDNVFVTTSENENFKIDFGGKVSMQGEGKIFRLPDKPALDNPEILKANKKEVSRIQQQKNSDNLKKRFSIISLIVLGAYLLNLLVPIFSNDIMTFERTTWVICLGLGGWFSLDCEMLSNDRYYFKCFWIAIGSLLYGYLISDYFLPYFSETLFAASMGPLTLLVVQWPTRRAYKLIFRREPITYARTGPWADLPYTIIHWFSLGVLPLLIVDYLN